MKAQSILPFWNQENASSSQRWKTLAELFNDYSSSSLSENPSWLDSWRHLWDLKPENEGGNLSPFDASIDGRVEPQLLWCRKPSMFAFSQNLIWILQERVVVALLRRLHRSHWGNLYLCGLWLWRYVCFLQLADCCFSCTMIRFFSLTLRLAPAVDCFHYVTYDIFALWFSPNQMFVIKFSVSFATVVERTRPLHVFIEVFARQKKLKESNRTPFPPTDNTGGLKSLLLWWKTCIFVHLMPNECSCYDLHVVVLFFFSA